MVEVFRISSDSNKNNRAQTIICIPTSRRRNSSSNSTSLTSSILNQLKSPSLTYSDSTVLQLKHLQWLKVTTLVSMVVPGVTAASHTCNRVTVVVGSRQVLLVRHSMGPQRDMPAAPDSYQTTLYNSYVSLSLPFFKLQFKRADLFVVNNQFWFYPCWS